jgi:thioesterase domain-containing protein
VPPLEIADIYAAARVQYRPGTVAARVALVRAQDGDEAARGLVQDPLLGWAQHTTRGLEIVDAAGGHSSILEEPYVDELAKKLIALFQTQ